MQSEVLEKLKNNKKYHEFLRENSNWYKELNRNPLNYNKFVKEMKEKYKLRTVDKVDNFINSVDLVTKIINASDK